jgi:Fe-S oxidoreductase
MSTREGSLEAPIRHPIRWREPGYYDEQAVLKEIERVFDICHGCRRCVSLCHAFPTLFDLVDASPTLEVDGVAKNDFWKVIEHCYLCDLCYMTKCPYVPPHPWNVDFPHLMLQAKAVRFKQGKSRLRDRILTSTDRVGSIAGIPVVAEAVNAANCNAAARKLLDKALGVHPDAVLPEFRSATFRRQFRRQPAPELAPQPTEHTRGQAALFVTCYGNRHNPDVVLDLVAVLRHNGIPVRVASRENCCGMPKLELGDLDAVARLKERNIPVLAALVDAGWDLLAPVPSCVLMFKQELPLLFPDDPEVRKVAEAMFDPFEYLFLRHKAGKMNTDFRNSLGRIAYHAPCHQRVQNIGPKTREILELVPGTRIESIERCSGHDGIYAVKSECHEISRRICRPVARRMQELKADHYVSDCPMAGNHIANVMGGRGSITSPFALLRQAYGI